MPVKLGVIESMSEYLSSILTLQKPVLNPNV